MRFFMLVILSLSLTGLIGCGEDQTPDNDIPPSGDISDAGANDKPSETEKRQFASAKNQLVAVAHKSAQILSFNQQKATLRVLMSINNQDVSGTFSMDGDSDTFSRQIVQGDTLLELEVIMVRSEVGNRAVIGLEYRLSRQSGNRTYTASQFLSLRTDLLNTNNAVIKKKFEFPSSSNIFTWVKQ